MIKVCTDKPTSNLKKQQQTFSCKVLLWLFIVKFLAMGNFIDFHWMCSAMLKNRVIANEGGRGERNPETKADD